MRDRRPKVPSEPKLNHPPRWMIDADSDDDETRGIITGQGDEIKPLDGGGY